MKYAYEQTYAQIYKNKGFRPINERLPTQKLGSVLKKNAKEESEDPHKRPVSFIEQPPWWGGAGGPMWKEEEEVMAFWGINTLVILC